MKFSKLSNLDANKNIRQAMQSAIDFKKLKPRKYFYALL
jgi:hypothetical protein